MKTVGLDFDGVLNLYNGWKGESHCADPRPGVREFLVRLREAGYSPVIYSTRSPGTIITWLEKHNLGSLIDRVTNVKPVCIVILDDRAVTFRGDFDAAFDEIVNFQAFWQT